MRNSSFLIKSLVMSLWMAWGMIVGSASPALGQELNVSVEVDQSQITGSATGHVENLDEEIEEYLNRHDWIEADFEQVERINAAMQITLLSVDDNFNFEANIVVRSMRPIYNTTRETNVFLFNDENWSFNYTPNRGFVHDDLQFDRLASLLDYYAYMIIGYDYDTFSELGGSSYFSEAANIVSLARSAGGWSQSSGRRDRGQITADLQNPNYEPLRRALYVYHRLGVDTFVDDPAGARREVIRALELIRTARRNTTNNLLFDLFFNAKYRELVSVFEDASTEVRLQAYNLLTEIDQGHLSEYNKLQQ